MIESNERIIELKMGTHLIPGRKDSTTPSGSAGTGTGDALRPRRARLERDVASTQAQTPEGVQHIIRSSFACNQRCLYCYARLSGRRVSMAEIGRTLDSFRRLAPLKRWISISGGEPAADPRLCEIIRLARAKGFSDIELQTNAVFLCRRGLVENLIASGVGRFFVSSPSFRPKTYDLLTGSRKQLPLALKGIENLLAHPLVGDSCRLCINIVVNRLNVSSLAAHVDFLSKLNDGHRKPFAVFFSVMNAIGHEKAPSIALDFRELAPSLNAALRRCAAAGIAVERFSGPSAPPVCLVESPAPYACDQPVSQDDVGFYPRDFDLPGRGEEEIGRDGRRRLNRAKRSACRRCRYDRRCGGVCLEYARLFGVSALRPVSEDGRRP